MGPDNLRFGGGAADTVLHPVIAVAMLISVVLILVLPRNKAIAPFLVGFFTIPLAQVVVVAGVHFPVLRILILTVVARMILLPPSGRRIPGGFNALDAVVVLWTVSTLITFFIQFPESQAIIKGFGDFTDNLGGYLAVRYLICDRDTVRRTIKALAAICVIQAGLTLSEQFTHHNVMTFAGASEPNIREGHVRSEGTLGSLYGGTFAGVLVPIFLSQWKERKTRMAAYAGVVGATVWVISTHASTSALAYAGGVGALAFWPMRRSMRLFRWGLASTLVALHLVMKAPVWALIARVDVTGGSSGWQRYFLVDMCIRHFRDWWLYGSQNYPSWGWGAWDLCNQFVAVALTGGLVTLILYIIIFKRALGAIGTARKRVAGDRRQEWFIWCLGCTFVAIIVSHFGINYMLQLKMCLFPLLSIVSITCLARETVPAVKPEAAEEEHFASASTVADSFTW